MYLPVTQDITGSNPVSIAKQIWKTKPSYGLAAALLKSEGPERVVRVRDPGFPPNIDTYSNQNLQVRLLFPPL